jgi:hypothetical protein
MTRGQHSFSLRSRLKPAWHNFACGQGVREEANKLGTVRLYYDSSGNRADKGHETVLGTK